MSNPITPSTEASTAPEVAPVVVATPEPVAAPVAAEPASAPAVEVPDIHGLDEATRDALLFGGDVPAAKVAPVPAVTAAPAPVAEPTVAEPVATPAVEPVVAEPVTPADPDKILPNRINTAQFSTREQEAIALKHDLAKDGTEISLREACERVDAKYGVSAVAPQSTEPAVPQVPAEIVSAREEIAALEARLDAIDTEGGLMTPEISSLIKTHATKLAALTKLEFRHELAAERQAESAHAQQASARNDVKAQVLEQYPTANDDNSTLGKEIGLLYSRIQGDPGHPLHSKIADNNFPALLTEAAVDSKKAELINLGFTEAQALAAIKGQPITEVKGPVVPVTVPKTTTQVAPVPRNILVTAPGGKQAPEPVVLSEAQVLEAARKDPKLRDQALGFTDERVVS